MRKKFCLVDDNPGEVKLVELAFKELNATAELIHYSNSSHLIEFLSSNTDGGVAAIILDMHLADEHGLDILPMIERALDSKRVPIIVFSTAYEKELVHRAYVLGANAYVRKPQSMEEYQATIAAIVEFWAHVNITPY